MHFWLEDRSLPIVCTRPATWRKLISGLSAKELTWSYSPEPGRATAIRAPS